MATIDGIGLQEPSTVTKSLAAIPITRNSSVTYQEIMVIGDPDSTTSSAVAKVTNSAPGSTAWGLVTRQAGPIAVTNSTASDFVSNVSSVAGIVAVRPSDTNWASSAGFHFDSSGALQITGATASTQVSVSRPSSYVMVAQSTVGQTTATVLISSAATIPYVSAFTVTSTEAGPIVGGFYAGSTLIWPVVLWAEGGQITVTQAVAQPGYVFFGQANRPLEYRITSGSTGSISVALTYRPE